MQILTVADRMHQVTVNTNYTFSFPSFLCLNGVPLLIIVFMSLTSLPNGESICALRFATELSPILQCFIVALYLKTNLARNILTVLSPAIGFLALQHKYTIA